MTFEKLFARFSSELLEQLDSSIGAASSSRHDDGKSAEAVFAHPHDESPHPCGSRVVGIEAFSDALHRWIEQQNARDWPASSIRPSSSRLNAIKTGNSPAGVGTHRPLSGSSLRTAATRRSRKSKGGESESGGTK